MAKPIGLIAVTDIDEHGVTVNAGEYFTTTPIIAAALTYRRQAKFAAKPEPKRKRTYRRRDMTAETLETSGE